MRKNERNPTPDDPLLALCGSGKAIWADEHADDYVRRIREGWDDSTEPQADEPRITIVPNRGPS